MSGFQEYDRFDGVGLADLVKRGEVPASDLLEEAITRIEQRNPPLNAVIHKMYDQAETALKDGLPKGPFEGVPFLLKDLLSAYAGVPMTSGSRAYRSYIPDYDSEIVRRYKMAGLLIVGKTNTPELGLVGYTEPELFGPTRNPWDLGLTPGGSSGGSASAVAAGMVPLAGGGDGGGSIRIPSSYCGLFGLKPSRGRTPTGPVKGELWQGAAQEHVLTRSVRDSAAILDAIQGDEPGSPYVIRSPEAPYLIEAGRDPGVLRIAWDTGSPVGKAVHPESIRAVERAVQLLSELGHIVEESHPQIDGQSLAKAYLIMNMGEVADEVRQVKALFGKSASRDELELVTQVLALLGETISAGDFVAAKREWQSAARVVGRFFQTYDLYLTPTVAAPPLKIGELALTQGERALLLVITRLKAGKLLIASGLIDKLAVENLAAVPYTQLANLSGLPAMSVPLHWTANGLPMGVHFMAPNGSEDLLFRLAGQLERTCPWFDKRPQLVMQ
jgi:amidase